jgi:hypothetical protein
LNNLFQSVVVLKPGFSLTILDKPPPLAPGVTQKDVDLYKMIREKASAAVAEIMEAYISKESSLEPAAEVPSTSQAALVTPSNSSSALVPTTSQSASISKVNTGKIMFNPSPTTVAVIAQERCPSAIEFGKYEIATWYSSPFPQEYAR